MSPLLLVLAQSLSMASIKRVITEVQDLVTSPPEDIRVQLNEDDITDITAFIRGPGASTKTQAMPFFHNGYFSTYHRPFGLQWLLFTVL